MKRRGVIANGHQDPRSGLATLTFKDNEIVFLDSFGVRQFVHAFWDAGIATAVGYEIEYETDDFGCLVGFSFVQEVESG